MNGLYQIAVRHLSEIYIIAIDCIGPYVTRGKDAPDGFRIYTNIFCKIAVNFLLLGRYQPYGAFTALQLSNHSSVKVSLLPYAIRRNLHIRLQFLRKELGDAIVGIRLPGGHRYSFSKNIGKNYKYLMKK